MWPLTLTHVTFDPGLCDPWSFSLYIMFASKISSAFYFTCQHEGTTRHMDKYQHLRAHHTWAQVGYKYSLGLELLIQKINPYRNLYILNAWVFLLTVWVCSFLSLGSYHFLPEGGGASVCDGQSPIFSGPPFACVKNFGSPFAYGEKNCGPPPLASWKNFAPPKVKEHPTHINNGGGIN